MPMKIMYGWLRLEIVWLIDRIDKNKAINFTNKIYSFNDFDYDFENHKLKMLNKALFEQ